MYCGDVYSRTLVYPHRTLGYYKAGNLGNIHKASYVISYIPIFHLETIGKNLRNCEFYIGKCR